MEDISRKEFDDFRQEVDQRIRALGDRIGDIDRKFDEKIKMLDTLFKTKDDWKAYVDKSHDALCETIDTCKDMLAENMNEIGRVRTFAYDKSKEVDSIKTYISDLKKSIDSKWEHIYSQKESIDRLNKEYETLASLIEKISESIKSKDAEYNKSIRDAFETIFSAKRETQAVALRLHEVNALYQKLESEINKLSKSSEYCLEHIPKVYQELIVELKAQKEELLHLINSELEEIFIPDVSHFVREDDIRKMRHEIDLCNLDSKNAFDKASNVDMQTTINSKKIESLQLKLNQLELKHQ